MTHAADRVIPISCRLLRDSEHVLLPTKCLDVPRQACLGPACGPFRPSNDRAPQRSVGFHPARAMSSRTWGRDIAPDHNQVSLRISDIGAGSWVLLVVQVK